jgi:hypothetical protein
MKIQVTFDMDEGDDLADPLHEMGVTEEGYEYLLRVIPGDDIDIKRVD